MIEKVGSILRDITIHHQVNHTVKYEYGKRPRPQYITLVISDGMGRTWKTAPMYLSGQTSLPVNLPVEWLTGRIEDMSKYPPAQMRIEYDG